MIERLVTESGAKAIQRPEHEDRIWQYNLFHKNLDKRFYSANLDSVEYGYDKDGNKVYLAVIELTRMNSDTPPPRSYLAAILERFTKRDSQAAFARDIAAAIGVDCYLALYRVPQDNSEKIQEFWLYRLSGEPFATKKSVDGWVCLSTRQYEEFLRLLRIKRGV